MAENKRQWESRKAELRNEEQREQQLKVEAATSRKEIDTLRPKRQNLDGIILKQQALLEDVDQQKHVLSTVIQSWSTKYQEYSAAAKQHEMIRSKLDDFLREQLIAQRAAERQAREVREALEAEERRKNQPIQIFLSLMRSILINIKTFLGLIPPNANAEINGIGR
jgi:hypothetical protein